MEKTLKKYFPLFVLPTLAAFIIGFIVPFAEGIYLSFCKFTTVGNASWVGVSNYVKAFSDATFRSAFWFTLGFTAVSTILINVLAFAIALLLTLLISPLFPQNISVMLPITPELTLSSFAILTVLTVGSFLISVGAVLIFSMVTDAAMRKRRQAQKRNDL